MKNKEPRREPAARPKLIAAAAREFADNGFKGTRMEHVATRAGCNKALIYRYFGDKEGLFQAVLGDLFTRREQTLESAPTVLDEGLEYWYRSTVVETDFLTLLLREALTDDGGEPVEAERRRAYYQKQIDGIRSAQADNPALGQGLEPDTLFLALLALITFPKLLPQVARLVTGQQPGTEAFDQRWSDCLNGLARHLGDDRR